MVSKMSPPVSDHPNSVLASTRCPELLTGMNSVVPWIMASAIACQKLNWDSIRLPEKGNSIV